MANNKENKTIDREALEKELNEAAELQEEKPVEMGSKLSGLLKKEISDYKKRNKTRAADMISIFAAHNFYANGFTPVELRTTLEDLGPTYVKIGQIMSSRVDLLPEAYCKELEKLHLAVASRVFRKLWANALGFEHVAELMKLICGEGLAFADIPGGRIRRERGRIYFDNEREPESIKDRPLVINGTLDVPEAGLKIHCFKENFGKEVYGLFNTFVLKYENIQGVVCCTAWRDGDKIRPIGRNCTKTLKALFNEKKMTRAQKLSCPVIRDEAGVLAVNGFAADERTKAEVGDKILRITIEKY